MADLLEEIETHLSDTNTAATAFGREVMGDPNFVTDLRDGRDYRRSTAEKVRLFLSKSKPPCPEHGHEGTQSQ